MVTVRMLGGRIICGDPAASAAEDGRSRIRSRVPVGRRGNTYDIDGTVLLAVAMLLAPPADREDGTDLER